MASQTPCPGATTTFPPPSPPFPSFPLPPPSLVRILSFSPLTAVLVSPTDPLLPVIAAAQAEDAALSAIIKQLPGGPGGESNPALPGGRPSFRSGGGPYSMHGGLLYNQSRILVPPTAAALILSILQQYHDSPLAGHYGVARTQALVGQYFQWPGLATTVERYVRSCDACQRNKVAATESPTCEHEHCAKGATFRCARHVEQVGPYAYNIIQY